MKNMKKNLCYTFALLACALALIPLTTYAAENPTPTTTRPTKIGQASPSDGVTMDFQQADIHQLIRYISEVTGRNFITTPNVKGKITVYSPVKISPEEAFDTFVSILRVHGFAVQKTGEAYTILPFKEGMRQTGDVIFGDKTSKTLQSIETRIIPLKYGVAKELAKVLPSILVSDYAVTSYGPTNTLVITAPSMNMNTVLSFLAEVESSHKEGQTVITQLKFGNAKILAEVLTKMLNGRNEEAAKQGIIRVSLVVPDERTNTLIIYGDDEAVLIASETIKRLDIPTPQGKGDVHHVTLNNATAEDLAEVLNSLVERQVTGSGTEGEQDTVLSRDIKVVPDPATNSLVITARADEFEALLDIIKKLDIVRKQVFIEALIMEVNTNNDFSFGVNWALAQQDGDFAIFGGANTGGASPSINSASKMIALPSGLSLGAIMLDAFSIGGTEYNVQSILNMVKGNSDVNVLATPQLLTLDNEEASVEVVDNIPFAKESTESNTADYTTQSMDYKDVGVKLKVIPRISDDGSLRLEIEQEVSRVVDSVLTLADGNVLVAPTTRKRMLKSTVLLQDSQTAVIGGLLDDSTTTTQTGVPVLSEIPLLGWLFKSRIEKKAQIALFIFITPKVIRNRTDLADLTGEKKQQIHQTGMGADGIALSVMSKPKLLNPVFVY